MLYKIDKITDSIGKDYHRVSCTKSFFGISIGKQIILSHWKTKKEADDCVSDEKFEDMTGIVL